MDERQMNITVSAYLKSIIERGADETTWEDLTKKAIATHLRVMAEWKAFLEDSDVSK